LGSLARILLFVFFVFLLAGCGQVGEAPPTLEPSEIPEALVVSPTSDPLYDFYKATGPERAATAESIKPASRLTAQDIKTIMEKEGAVPVGFPEEPYVVDLLRDRTAWLAESGYNVDDPKAAGYTALRIITWTAGDGGFRWGVAPVGKNGDVAAWLQEEDGNMKSGWRFAERASWDSLLDPTLHPEKRDWRYGPLPGKLAPGDRFVVLGYGERELLVETDAAGNPLRYLDTIKQEMVDILGAAVEAPTATATLASTATATKESTKTSEPTPEPKEIKGESCFDQAAIKAVTDKFMKNRPEADINEAVSAILKEAGVDEEKGDLVLYESEKESDVVEVVQIPHAVLLGFYTVENINGMGLTVRCPVVGVGRGFILSGLFDGRDAAGNFSWAPLSQFASDGVHLKDQKESGIEGTWDGIGRKLDELVGGTMRARFVLSTISQSSRFDYLTSDWFLLSPLIKGSFADLSPGNPRAVKITWEDAGLVSEANLEGFFRGVAEAGDAGVYMNLTYR